MSTLFNSSNRYEYNNWQYVIHLYLSFSFTLTHNHTWLIHLQFINVVLYCISYYFCFCAIQFQGLTTNVTVGGHNLEGWTIVPLPLTNSTRLAAALTRLPPLSFQATLTEGRMSFFQGTFNVSAEGSEPHDTFLRLDGWNKVRLGAN